MNTTTELTATNFLKKLAGFSMASWLSAAISFLVTPIFTRLYLPEEIGHINLFTTYMTFFQTICVFALDQAFMRFYNENLDGLNKNNILNYCLKINLYIYTIIFFVILSNTDFFSYQISGEKSYFIPLCLSIVIICSTFLRMSSISSRMEKNIIHYTIQVILTTCIEKVILTCTAFYNPTYKTAIFTMTIGYIILSLSFLLIKRKYILFFSNKVPWNTTLSILKFSLPYLPVLILSWLNSSIPLLVLKNYVSYSSVGIYTNAVTIASILHIIQTGFSAYWNPFIYEYYKDTYNKEKVQKIEKIIIMIILFAAISIVLFQDIIYLLVGEKFRASKIFFPFLMMTPICNSIADMTGVGIMLSKKSYLNIFTFIGNTSINLILSYLLVPKIGVMGAGIAVCCSALVMLMIRSYLGGKYYKITPNNWFIVFALSLMVGACIVNVIMSELFLLKSIILLIFLGILCIIFKKEFLYLKSFCNKIILKFLRYCKEK